MASLFSTIKNIKQLAGTIPNIGLVADGDIYDTLNGNMDITYPAFVITQGQHSILDEDSERINLTFFAVDRLTSDKSNRLDVQSWANSVLKVMIDTIENNGIGIIMDSYSIQPFTEKFESLCAGCYATLNVKINPNDCNNYELALPLKDVKVNGFSVVDSMGNANINLSDYVTNSKLEKTANEIRSEIPDVSGFITDETDPTVPTYVKNITEGDISNWNSKTSFDGDYNSLTNTPDLSIYLTEETFTAAPASGITETDISNWNSKTSFDGDYNSLSNVPDLDIYLTKETFNSSPATGITEENISNWNSKTSFDGDYNSLSNTPDLSIYLTEETDPTVPTYVKNISETDISNWNSKTSFDGDYNSLSNVPDLDVYLTKETFNSSPATGITETDINNWNTKTSFDGDYNSLSNKPNLDVYLTTETDPTVPSHVKNITEEDIELWNKGGNIDLSNYATKDEIPSLEGYAKTDEIPDVSGFITNETDPTVPTYVKNITQSDISNWNNKTSFDGDYNNLSNKPNLSIYLTEETDPTVPSHVKNITEEDIVLWNKGGNVDLTNYVTITQLNQKNYATKYEIPDVSGFITNETDPTVPSHVKNITTADIEKWNKGGNVDLSNYAKKSEIPSLEGYAKTTDIPDVSGFITEETDPTVPDYVKNITQSDINNWNSKTSFDGNYNNLSNKPNLSQYITSETDPTVPSHVKNITQSDINNWNSKTSFDGNYNNLSNKPNLSQYITSETDPVFSASPAAGISNSDIAVWNSMVAQSGDRHVLLTKAEYEALSEDEQNNGAIYLITDIGEEDPTVPSHVKNITEEDIAKWNSGTGSSSGGSGINMMTLDEYNNLGEEFDPNKLYCITDDDYAFTMFNLDDYATTDYVDEALANFNPGTEVNFDDSTFGILRINNVIYNRNYFTGEPDYFWKGGNSWKFHGFQLGSTGRDYAQFWDWGGICKFNIARDQYISDYDNYDGQIYTKEVARITPDGIYELGTLLSDKYLAKSDVPDMSNFTTTEYVDSKLGDIDTILNKILNA